MSSFHEGRFSRDSFRATQSNHLFGTQSVSYREVVDLEASQCLL